MSNHRAKHRLDRPIKWAVIEPVSGLPIMDRRGGTMFVWAFTRKSANHQAKTAVGRPIEVLDRGYA